MQASLRVNIEPSEAFMATPSARRWAGGARGAAQARRLRRASTAPRRASRGPRAAEPLPAAARTGVGRVMLRPRARPPARQRSPSRSISPRSASTSSSWSSSKRFAMTASSYCLSCVL